MLSHDHPKSTIGRGATRRRRAPAALVDVPVVDVPRLRVLVVHGQQLVQLGFRTLLGQLPWVERCVPALTADEAIERAHRYEPHVVVVELALGPAVCERILEAAPAARTVLLGACQVPRELMRDAGVVGLVSESADLADVVTALRDAALGRALPTAVDAPEALSSREQQVLAHLAAGQTNREIGAALFLHPDTVKHHTQAVFRKLGARNRTQAVMRAQRLGMLAWAPSSVLDGGRCER